MEKKLNLFCEFILNNYTSKDAVIEVCDCQNFIVIKGFSCEETVISMQTVIDEFLKKYDNYNIKNVIDLIEYKKELSTPKNFEFYFGKNLQTEGSFFKTSEFPFGYSMSQGKLLYFYFKHIVDRIPSHYPFTWIKFNISVSGTNEIDFTIEDDYLNNEDDVLKSSILDCFDFNLTEFESKLKKMDLEKYILNPSEGNIIDGIIVKDFLVI